ncbi:type I polyketide synthase [Oceaniglobus ichthyenteri]|uniref:type I polyketide synthase n=1 Tax=Oceaniglobus ichthyenteri TaxID=2136177 RepID=UPI000D3B07C5|nr:type I polyketide synthase [Oceaniglobus ichthyenteri]
MNDKTNPKGEDIAIVGMALTVPGADTPGQFWQNLRTGTESIRRLNEEELLANGESESMMRRKNYVPAAAVLDGFDMFDADFFGFSPKEAAILDPQHRKFLETAWQAMEDAGHTPASLGGQVGVYAGCGMGSYFYFNICSNPDLVEDTGMFLLRHTGNDKDFLSTRVSHVFDLKGPSINLQTACSTSLVAVHYACKALNDGECDMALAGGVTIELPQGRGYEFKENEILSPDGHCHAFDHRAEGTVFGSGSGTVALRRLSDAIADGDHIYAVIKGSAINNDGAAKAGYLAPSVDGQAAAIVKALAAADVPAETIDYVECHGTGTYLGDPIEVTALTEAYRTQTDATGFAHIGSVKTNIGHLDTAAGVAGLIKATLGLYHGEIPPSLGYEKPNPAIDFDTSPFQVADRLIPWHSHKGPRRAAINALGVGGTNAHAIIEQAPARATSEESDFPFQIITLSAKSKASLEAQSANLAAHLTNNPDQALADIAFTLKAGRHGFEKRRTLVAETHADAIALLQSNDPRRVFTHDKIADAPDIVFMFPGGGAQYPDMARDLYETEPVFAEWMDRGLDHLQPQLDYDIRALWLPEPADRDAAAKALQKPSVQLPLIMIVEYALAQLWLSWGVKPRALIGHSMGENTAACLAGVLDFEECIDLVLLRGRLFDTVAPGGMLSVSLPLAELEPLLGPEIDIASVNAPSLTAVSGPQTALDELQADLSAQDVEWQRIPIDIAAHSRMLDPILAEYRAFLTKLDLSPPAIPVISNRTGTPLTREQATDPEYWVSQLRNTVQFSAGMAHFAQNPRNVYLEVGPGKALSSLAQMAQGVSPNQVLSSLRHPDQDMADDAYFFQTIGRLWAVGVEADWHQIWGGARRNRVSLPTYPFQRTRYFIEPGKTVAMEDVALPSRHDDLSDWGYRESWRHTLSALDVDIEEAITTPCNWIIFADETGVSNAISARLTDAGHTVITITSGDTFARLSDTTYSIAPEQGRDGYDNLLQDLQERDILPTRIAHFWLLTNKETCRPGSSFFDRNQEHGFYSLLYLAQALADAEIEDAHITCITNGAIQTTTEPLPYPEKSMVSGPLGVIPRELPGLTTAHIDIELPRRPKTQDIETISQNLLEDLLAEPENTTAAWRDNKRFAPSIRPVKLPQPDSEAFRDGGTYLITGGFGGIGLTVAADLIKRHQANIVLLSRTPLPTSDAWDKHLRTHAPQDKVSCAINALRDLEAIGGNVMVCTADVCDVDQMRTAAREATARFGAISGVIHAAGVVDDGPLLTKTQLEAESVFAPKVNGLRVIDDVFPDGTLDLLVLFSSSSTSIRAAGQVDYVAANAYLNAFAQSRKHAKTKVISVNWGVWADVGMAANATASELAAPEIPTDQPLLQRATFDADGNRVFLTNLTTDQWVLNDHRTQAGDAILPGTGYIEIAAQALAAQEQSGPFELADLTFFTALDVGGSDREMRVRLSPGDDGTLFEVRSAVTLEDRTGHQLNAQGTLLPLDDTPGQLDLDSIRTRMSDQRASDGRLRSPQETQLKFGPRWHVLRSMALGDGEGMARLALAPEFQGDLEHFTLHPGLMDLATGWAIELVPGYSAQHLWVPLSYGAIRVYHPLTPEIVSWMRLTPGVDQIDGFASFDITLTDTDGNILIEVYDFAMKRLATATSFGKATVRASEVEFSETGPRPQSGAEERLAETVALGIRPADGPEALRRALGLATAQDLAQITVSSIDLNALIKQAAEPNRDTVTSGQTFERPQIDSDFIAPRNEIEQTLAQMWQTLLGIGQVGVEDSFFDLGGHSLIAVRLFAQINKAYGVQFPISVLFEAPTIAACAEMIAARVGHVTGASADANSPAPKAEKFEHLVALHQGAGGQKTPMFIVAGMFGNVMNLRHLGLSLGQDRPVYGLQARGLIGDAEPHHTIGDAAQAYIAEIQQVQPQGPYLLGGFSGGGITAYDMAGRLQQMGEDVSVLALLDTPLPVRPALSKRDKALIKADEIRRKGWRYVGEWAKNRIAWEIEKRRAPDTPGNSTAFDNAKIEAAFRGAVERYDMQRWNGPLTLFRPPLDRHWQVSNGNWVSAAREYVFEDNQLTQFAPNIQVIEVPGDHDSMVLVPNVNVLTARLKQVIRTAERRNRTPRTHRLEAAE